MGKLVNLGERRRAAIRAAWKNEAKLRAARFPVFTWSERNEPIAEPCPPITEKLAIEIASEASGQEPYEWATEDGPPVNFHPYGFRNDPGNCWFIYVPWGDGLDGQVLRSSRVIAVCKNTGAVVYDGSAGDEG